MAMFIPDTPLDDIPHDSERLVYEALKALPSNYIVMHSFPWLRPNRNYSSEPLREGEADFIVIDRTRGFLVVEVKGGYPELKNRVWERSGKTMRDPFEQARRNRYALLDSIEASSGKRLSRSMMVHGDVVVFPHVRYRGEVPVNADPRILLDAGSLASLSEEIDKAFAAWTKQSGRLSSGDLNELLEALLPKLRLMRCAGSELQGESQKLVQVTLDQRETLSGLLESNRVLVQGGAGSGKTLLALEFALTLARRAQNVLFLCFNRHLAVWLNEQARSDPRFSTLSGTLEVATFHAFAKRLAEKAGVEFEVPEQNDQHFWEDELPLILEQAIEVLGSRGSPILFDAVVVDEAQDFSTDWWVTIHSLLKFGEAGKLYAFLDLKQGLRGAPRLPPVPFDSKFTLSTNCRNTKCIAKSASTLADIELRILPGAPMGQPPGIRRTISQTTEAGLVLSELRQVLEQDIAPGQIALIGPTTLSKGLLSAHSGLNGVRFVTDASEWRRGMGVLVTTARAFKGLEADVVFLYGLSGFGQQFTETDLYVAWTRAKHRLILFCQPGEVRARVEQAIQSAEDVLR